MSTLVTILHVLVCLFLMLTVLLQQGKGGGMGGAFGGSNAGSVFGGAGASTFLRRLTAVGATIFMLTSMVLAFLASRDAGNSLEKYSNNEAARRKRAQEAEKRAFEGIDAGASVTPDGDAGVSSTPTIDPAIPAIAPTIDPASGTVTPPAGAGGAEVPAEIPAATPPATTPPATRPPATTPPATTPPATTPPATRPTPAATTPTPAATTPPATPPVAPVTP